MGRDQLHEVDADEGTVLKWIYNKGCEVVDWIQLAQGIT
jgi:hypothetical protein